MAMRLTDEQLDWLCERVPDARRNPLGGRPATCKRKVIAGIFWILDNGAKWKDLPREDAHVVIVGFQARGTVGRALVDGAAAVKLWGEEVPVRARVHTVGGFSAHAGCTELLAWARPLVESGAEIALVHGEVDKRDAFASLLEPLAPRRVHCPARGDRVVLTARGGRLRFESA